MRYIDLAEDVLRRVHGGDIPDSAVPSMEDGIIAVAEAVPFVIMEDYKDRYKITRDKRITDDAFTTFKNIPVFTDSDTDQKYALLPLEPAIISQDSTPRVEYMKDRMAKFVYREGNNKGALDRLGVATLTGDIPFWYERVGWENRLIFGPELSECSDKLKVSMVIATVDPHTLDPDTNVSLPGRLIMLVKNVAFRYLTDKNFRDAFNDNQ